MARYRVDITKAKQRCIANGRIIWDEIDSTFIYVNAPNKYEAEYRLNSKLKEEPGFQYFVDIKTDNKKKDSDDEQSTVSDKKPVRQKRATKVQSSNKRAGNKRSKTTSKKTSKS